MQMRGEILKFPMPKKGVIWSRKSKDRQYNGQNEKKDKQRSTNHYIEN